MMFYTPMCFCLCVSIERIHLNVDVGQWNGKKGHWSATVLLLYTMRHPSSMCAYQNIGYK